MLTFFKYQLQNQDLKPEAQLPMISKKSDGYLCLAHFCICAFFLSFAHDLCKPEGNVSYQKVCCTKLVVKMK